MGSCAWHGRTNAEVSYNHENDSTNDRTDARAERRADAWADGDGVQLYDATRSTGTALSCSKHCMAAGFQVNALTQPTYAIIVHVVALVLLLM